jgi:hypothetical protein
MNECIAIDFRPSDEVVPSILSLLDREGYTLKTIRLVPTNGDERATLRLDVDHCPSMRVRSLVERLRQWDSIIEVIHRAETVS